MKKISTLIEGTFIHTKNGILEILENHYMLISPEGKISYFSKEKPSLELLSNVSTTYKLSKTELILPGFIDCHIHAPQYVNSGCGLDLQLLEWLNQYTFPAESKFTSKDHAKLFIQLLYHELFHLVLLLHVILLQYTKKHLSF